MDRISDIFDKNKISYDIISSDPSLTDKNGNPYPKVLKWIQDYNEKVKKSTDLSKKLRIEQEALDKATSEAAQSQAEYAQSIVENAKKKLENIANYYDSFTSQWENKNSMYEAYMDRMQTQGYNLSTKFYEAEIGQQQKIVDNLSQKYIAMKRNFAQAVQDGKIVEGTEEYYEMQNEIDQVAISLKEAQNKVVEFQASIRDLKWEQFDQLQEARDVHHTISNTLLLFSLRMYIHISLLQTIRQKTFSLILMCQLVMDNLMILRTA